MVEAPAKIQLCDKDFKVKGDAKHLLHPVIAQKVWATFLRGDYDVAIFQAFREVEVRVREAAGFNNEDLGVPLMRNAFHKGDGPLTDLNAPAAERDAMAHLFAGAMGMFKNPTSHRNLTVEPDEAVEIIMLASYLLKVVDSRLAELNKPQKGKY